VDKRSGRHWDGLHRLEDTEDAGDEYDWSPAPRSRTVVTDGASGRVQTIEDTGLAATLRARFEMVLPAGLRDDRQGRREETVTCPVTVAVRLTCGGDLVEITTTFANAADDHRLRAWLPTGTRSEAVHSDGQFLVTARPVTPPDGADWVQPHPGTYPQQAFSAVADAGGHGLAVLADGLPEIAPRREEDGTVTLQLTLLRSVGWLSRDDFPTRRHTNAGPTVPTPEAQCRGEHTFRYALAPLLQGTAGLHRRARAWLDTPPVHQGVVAGAAPAGGLLELTGGEAAVSAIRRHPRRPTLLVRLWNPSDAPTSETLRLTLPVAAAWLCDLLEERQEDLPLGAAPTTEVLVPLLPHRIVTVELELAGREDAA
jgi:alpha-mannosidase